MRLVLVALACAALLGGSAFAQSGDEPQPAPAQADHVLPEGIFSEGPICGEYGVRYYAEPEGYPVCDGPPDPADAAYDEFSGPEAPEDTSDPGVPLEETFPPPDEHYVDGHAPSER
jgi:hypothetical protein